MGVRGRIIIGLALVATLLAVFLGFFAFSVAAMETIYRNSTFYFLLIAFALFLQQLLACLPDWSGIVRLVRQHWLPAGLALFLVLLALCASPPDFRILADETNLLGMSMAMYETHGCYNPTQAWNFYHSFRRTISSVVDMRPAFFSFLTYIAHTISGYRPENAFVVNAFAGFFCLFLTYYLTQRWFARFWGCVAMLLLASFPLFVLYMTSAGFETVNLLFALLLFALIGRFLQQPVASRAELVILILPLLAQTRYESALAVFVALPVILWFLPGDQYDRLTFRSVVVPFLFMPICWLRIVTFSQKAFQVSSVDEAFGFDLFVANLKKAVPFFLGFDKAYGMVTVIALMAVVSLVWVLVTTQEKRSWKAEDPAVLLAVVTIFMISHAAARFFYFWGNLTLQYTSRLGIIFLPFLAFLAVLGARRLFSYFGLARNWAVVGALMLILCGWPVAGQNLAVREIFYYREFKTVREFLQSSFPQKKDYILVSDLSNLYVPLNYSAISPEFLTDHLAEVERSLQKHTWQQVLVIQKIDYLSGLPTPGSKLPAAIKLKTIFESQLNVDQLIRVSSLIGTMEKMEQVSPPLH